MKEKMLENMRRHQEAEEERQRTAAQRRKNMRRNSLPCDNHRELCRREWEKVITFEFRQLERMLRRKQAAQLAAGKTFCALPLVGRPEEPRWLLLALALTWGNPDVWRVDEMQDLLLHHLRQPFAAGTTRASAFSRDEVTAALTHWAHAARAEICGGAAQVFAWLEELARPCFEGISLTSAVKKETLLRLLLLCEEEEPQYEVVTDRVPRELLTLLGLSQRDFAVASQAQLETRWSLKAARLT